MPLLYNRPWLYILNSNIKDVQAKLSVIHCRRRNVSVLTAKLIVLPSYGSFQNGCKTFKNDLDPRPRLLPLDLTFAPRHLTIDLWPSTITVSKLIKWLQGVHTFKVINCLIKDNRKLQKNLFEIFVYYSRVFVDYLYYWRLFDDYSHY
jgi:hypothetical protein